MRALLLTIALGCAVTQQKHLPDPHCDTSKKFVLADSALTVVAVAVGTGIAAYGSTSNNGNIQAGGVVLGFVWGGAHIVSAVIGNNWANTCRDLPQNSGERNGPVAR
jgi:hypothetical protein